MSGEWGTSFVHGRVKSSRSSPSQTAGGGTLTSLTKSDPPAPPASALSPAWKPCDSSPKRPRTPPCPWRHSAWTGRRWTARWTSWPAAIRHTVPWSGRIAGTPSASGDSSATVGISPSPGRWPDPTTSCWWSASSLCGSSGPRTRSRGRGIGFCLRGRAWAIVGRLVGRLSGVRCGAKEKNRSLELGVLEGER